MRVYIVSEEPYHDNGWPVGVFSDLSAAVGTARRLEENRHPHGPEIEITALMLDQPEGNVEILYGPYGGAAASRPLVDLLAGESA